MRNSVHSSVEELKERLEEKRSAISARLADFAAVRPEEYFYELAYCLLTPQSSALHASEAVEALKESDFLNSEVDASSVLRRSSSYIRFHNTKAKHLAKAREQYNEILAVLANGSTSEGLREWLVENVKGLGWKEASHFLRNIGHRDLSILDRHILRNLKKYGAIRAVPKTVTMKRYLSIERKFRLFAAAAGTTTDELDLLFWSMETGFILK